MTDDLKELVLHPTLHQILKYSFVGSKKTVKVQVKAFLDQTGVNELIAVSAMYDIDDRIKSTHAFIEIVTEINEDR